ncbi:mitochondrial carrier protein LEU5 [Basidiobolus meristosporus CBS 931.73]|uniref:Mitochondrial carrier protein LEU5 n=1 Tax=Basidiobolus meristosporus CBS 931.73 TaxID=1314790 RepID=A0A1Y1XS62_9FUNG|nr:mitochondrial carrier protein LEU5 [Basidiobolus meristosporus CBS 931.73]|eukprot:ORX88346.1 mitochondrial carrier protein LEU5 [Basidiobolus meristosporus CBS 931.73]
MSNTVIQTPIPASGTSSNLPSNLSSAARLQNRGKAKTETKSLSYVLKTFVAGGVAGCAAKTLVAPLDRVKILFQSSNPHFEKYSGTYLGVFKAGKEIFASTGIRGLFQGHLATLLRIFPYAAIKFVAYEQFKNVLVYSGHDTPRMEFVAGSLAGLSSVLCTYPLDLIRVRMAYEIPKNGGMPGFLDTLKLVYHEKIPSTSWIRLPVTNLYTGFGLTVVGVIPYAGVSFWTHSMMQKLFRSHFPNALVTKDRQTQETGEKVRLKAWAQLVSGGVAGALAQTVSYPIEVTRRHFQVRGAVNPENNRTTVKEVVTKIYRSKGVGGFFVGLSIGYLKVTPLVAVSFYAYERMKWLLNIH